MNQPRNPVIAPSLAADGKGPNDFKDHEAEPKLSVNGFQQVLEMLKIADPAFRESLLKRLATRDSELARTLRRDLANLGL